MADVPAVTFRRNLPFTWSSVSVVAPPELEERRFHYIALRRTPTFLYNEPIIVITRVLLNFSHRVILMEI